MATETLSQSSTLVQAPVIDIEEAPLDVHDEYSLARACGHDLDLTLSKFEVQDLASCLRGVSAIAAVLQAETMEAFSLGDFIRGGMLEAISALNGQAQKTLERAHDHEQKAQASRNPRGKAAA